MRFFNLLSLVCKKIYTAGESKRILTAENVIINNRFNFMNC